MQHFITIGLVILKVKIIPAVCRFTASCRYYLLKSQRPKISIFTTHRRLTAPIHVKFGTAEGNVGPLGRAKFHLSRSKARWVRGPQPQSLKIQFLVKIHPAAVINSCRCSGILYAQLPYFNCDLIRFTGYGRSYR